MKRLKKLKIINKIILVIILMVGFTGCVDTRLDMGEGISVEPSEEVTNPNSEEKLGENIQEDKAYYRMKDVAAYIHFYKKLPKNYLTKNEAKDLGWVPSEKNLWDVTDKGVIGGDNFGNFEQALPESSYKEADVNYDGGARGPERLVYDEDGNIFYTKNHYETFERIY